MSVKKSWIIAKKDLSIIKKRKNTEQMTSYDTLMVYNNFIGVLIIINSL